MADLGFFKGRGHSGATIYRGGPSIMQFFLFFLLRGTEMLSYFFISHPSLF